jgi:homoserine O-acetyltransferase
MSATAQPSVIGTILHELGDFELENGAILPGARIAYRSWGRLSATADNVVVVCHALTGSPDVDLWWSGLFGPERTLDPDRDFIICFNVLGSCYGSTGPASPTPHGHGNWGGDFPAVTVRDIVRSQRRLLDQLGVRGIRLVMGGSLGGMQALEWAIQDQRVESAAVIAAPARHSAWSIAISEAQRTAIAADPRWSDGYYDPASPPAAGLAAARQMAMCSYRTPTSLGERFDRRAKSDGEFEVASWLAYHGAQLVDRFDAACYVGLTHTMDSHDVGRGRGGHRRALEGLAIPILAVAIDSDGLYPPAEQLEIAEMAPLAELAWIHSPHGHDAFLIETADLDEQLSAFRNRAASYRRRLAS